MFKIHNISEHISYNYSCYLLAKILTGSEATEDRRHCYQQVWEYPRYSDLACRRLPVMCMIGHSVGVFAASVQGDRSRALRS